MKATLKLTRLSVTSFRTDGRRLAAQRLMGGQHPSQWRRACSPPADDTDPAKTQGGSTCDLNPMAGGSGNGPNGD